MIYEKNRKSGYRIRQKETNSFSLLFIPAISIGLSKHGLLQGMDKRNKKLFAEIQTKYLNMLSKNHNFQELRFP
jgi:hypothetical protein